MEKIYSKLSGVTHHNTDGTSRQEIIAELCYNGQPLLLIREPNQYSYNNIGVYLAYQVGYRTLLSFQVQQILFRLMKLMLQQTLASLLPMEMEFQVLN